MHFFWDTVTLTRIFGAIAQFDEHQFPFSGIITHNDISTLEISSFLDIAPTSAVLPKSAPEALPASLPPPCTLCPDTSDDSKSPPVEPYTPSIPCALPTPSTSHPMMTHARAGIFKPRYSIDIATTSLLSALSASTEPHDFKSAAKSLEWLAAMQQ